MAEGRGQKANKGAAIVGGMQACNEEAVAPVKGAGKKAHKGAAVEARNAEAAASVKGAGVKAQKAAARQAEAQKGKVITSIGLKGTNYLTNVVKGEDGKLSLRRQGRDPEGDPEGHVYEQERPGKGSSSSQGLPGGVRCHSPGGGGGGAVQWHSHYHNHHHHHHHYHHHNANWPLSRAQLAGYEVAAEDKVERLMPEDVEEQEVFQRPSAFKL